MARKKIPRVDSLPPEKQWDLHYTLSLTLLRAQTAHKLSASLMEYAETQFDQSGDIRWDVVGVVLSPAVEGHQAAWLYFACVEVAMEFWEKRGFPEGVWGKAEENSANRPILKDFRDAVFHGLPIRERGIASFYADWERLEPWASAALDAMVTYTRTWLTDYATRKSSPNTGC